MESSLTAAVTHSERSMYSAGYMVQARITEVEHTFVLLEGSMDSMRLLFEERIEVGRLESQRNELVWELLHLEQPMLQATRGQLLEVHRVLISIQLEYIHLQIEVGQVRSKPFVTARLYSEPANTDCTTVLWPSSHTGKVEWKPHNIACKLL